MGTSLRDRLAKARVSPVKRRSGHGIPETLAISVIFGVHGRERRRGRRRYAARKLAMSGRIDACKRSRRERRPTEARRSNEEAPTGDERGFFGSFGGNE
jgi:hypothetical protein